VNQRVEIGFEVKITPYKRAYTQSDNIQICGAIELKRGDTEANAPFGRQHQTQIGLNIEGRFGLKGELST
jgi:hypothetical protein